MRGPNGGGTVNLDDVVDALDKMPKGCIPMLLGDLNVDLDVPRNEQEARVAAVMDHHGMACASKHFTVRRRKECKLRGDGHGNTDNSRRRGHRGQNGGTN